MEVIDARCCLTGRDGPQPTDASGGGHEDLQGWRTLAANAPEGGKSD